MPDQRSPRDAIVDVLASAKVKSPFAFEEIADSIMLALAIAGADRQPDRAPTPKGSSSNCVNTRDWNFPQTEEPKRAHRQIMNAFHPREFACAIIIDTLGRRPGFTL